MLDIAVAYNRYRFLGNEFLTWVWFLIENDPDHLQQCDSDLIPLLVGNRMVLENRTVNGLETITIKGDAAGLEEALLALNKGAQVAEINLIYKTNVLEWQFSLKGENLSFTSLKLPETAAAETGDDMEAIVLEKLYLYEKPFQLVDVLYRHFIKMRLSPQWPRETISRIRKWLQATQPKETDSTPKTLDAGM
jgi:hypothetical protein